MKRKIECKTWAGDAKNRGLTVFSPNTKKNYPIWFENPEMRPMMSLDIFKKKIFPLIDNDEKVFL